MSMEPLKEWFCKGEDTTSPVEFEAVLFRIETNPPSISVNDNIREERWNNFSLEGVKIPTAREQNAKFLLQLSMGLLHKNFGFQKTMWQGRPLWRNLASSQVVSPHTHSALAMKNGLPYLSKELFWEAMQDISRNSKLALGYPLSDLKRLVQDEVQKSSLTAHAAQEMQLAEQTPIGMNYPERTPIFF